MEKDKYVDSNHNKAEWLYQYLTNQTSGKGLLPGMKRHFITKESIYQEKIVCHA